MTLLSSVRFATARPATASKAISDTIADSIADSTDDYAHDSRGDGRMACCVDRAPRAMPLGMNPNRLSATGTNCDDARRCDAA
jgi:hypothetical protein